MALLALRLRHLSRTSALGIALSALVALGMLFLLLARFFSATGEVVATVHQQREVIGPLVGHPAPDFTITLWNGVPGQQIHLAALRGKVVVVNFWASWCDPCHSEAPVLSQVAKSYAARGVVFVGIALETQDTDGREFIRQYHVPYGCGPAPDSVAVTYALTGIPVTVAINARGILVRQIEGPVTSSSLDSAIHAALGAGPASG
jgi:cytochrome c biogenesis protein CcmG, thiol:disulfide interchange protein DsbE